MNEMARTHIPAERSDKWFDMNNLGARLDRVPLDDLSSSYKLRLTVWDTKAVATSDPALVDEIQRDGWVRVESDGSAAVFENAQPANSASAVAAKVGLFFPEADVKANLKPIRDHAEKPEVFGLKPQGTDYVLKQLVEGVDQSDLIRMANTLNLAQRKADALRQKQEVSLFAGNGVEVFNALHNHMVNRPENPWNEIEGAAYVRSLMERASQSSLDQTARLMGDLGRALRDGDREATEDLVAAVVRPTENWSADDAARHPDLDNGFRKKLIESVELAARAENKIDVAEIAVGHQWGGQSIPALAMTSDPEITRNSASEVFVELKHDFPFDVREDGSTPTVQAAQSLAAIKKAFLATADAMGLPPENVLKNNNARFLRLSNDAVSGDSAVLGYQAAVKVDDESVVQAISTSVKSGRSFIHELGHAVDFSWGFTDQERDECLARSGVTGAIHDEIDRRFPPEAMDARAYYRDPKEMFARMFDAHICNVARENGDHSLQSIGGAHTTGGYDFGAPFGNIEATSSFMDEVRATIERKLDMGNTRDRDNKRGGPEQSSGASSSSPGM